MALARRVGQSSHDGMEQVAFGGFAPGAHQPGEAELPINRAEHFVNAGDHALLFAQFLEVDRQRLLILGRVALAGLSVVAETLDELDGLARAVGSGLDANEPRRLSKDGAKRSIKKGSAIVK